MRKILSIVCLLLSFQFAFSQSYIPNITKFTTENGLSSNEVHAIHKDARGFMWIGTQYGLNRFDGQEFKIYTRENTPGLNFNIINDIMEDDKGNLWLVKSKEKYQHLFTTIAINLFNIYSGEIQTLDEYFGNDLPFEVKDITFIRQLSDQSIFIHCNKIQKTFRYHSNEGFQSISFPDIFVQIADVLLIDERLLVSAATESNYSIYELNWKGELLNKGNEGLSWNIQDDKQVYQLETWGYYNLKALEHFSPHWDDTYHQLESSENNILQTEFNSHQKFFWLRNHHSLLVVTPDGQLVYTFPTIEENLGKMPFFFDGKITWFSDKKEGLVSVTLEPNYFQTFQFLENPIDNSMRGIIKDDSGLLWFDAVQGSGIMDAKNQVSITNREEGFSNFLKDREGNIWWGHYDGNLVKHDWRNNQESKFKIPQRNYIWSLFETDNGEIWIGAGHDNFIALNPETGEYTHKGNFSINERSIFEIYHFQKRDKETVWVCSNQGLFIVNLEGEVLATYNDQQTGEFYFPAIDFRHMYQASHPAENRTEIWIATGNAGLFQINKNTSKSFGEKSSLTIGQLKIEKHFNSRTGLSSNSIHGVYADEFDYLWISSDHGLMQLDRRDGQIYKYFESNGIKHNEFNRIAHYQDKDGQLFFGGLHGITSFHPKDFSKRREQTELLKLEIADFEQFSGEEGVFKNWTANLLKTNQIVLNPNDRIFKLKLGLLDYKNAAAGQTGGKNNIYQYRIKGLYDWQSTQNNELVISGLSYGDYILEVKAQNGNRQFTANKLAIDIQALRPFYLQAWFVILSLFGIGAGIFILLKKRTQRIMARREALQLKDLDKMKSRFFANISHELRTPLTLIGLPLELLMKNFDRFSKEEMMQYLQSAHSNKEDLNRLINEILDLSKLEAGKLQLEKKPVLLAAFLGKVVNVFHSSASFKKIELRFSSFIDKELKVNLDDSKLEMVLNNVLSNALKFTSEKGEITIHADWKDSEGLLVKIQDNGRGIHADDLPFVFERYFQSKQKNVNLEGGSGIGLAICKEFVELMGGTIQVDSKFGIGSIFTIQLPLEMVDTDVSIEVVEAPNKHTVSILPKESDLVFSKEKQNILIVEDHPELRKYLHNILSPKYNIQTAANGKEGLQMLSTASYQLIISDVMMPEMDGFTFLEKVKSQNEYCGIPFILLTARADIQDKLQGLRIGVDAYMTKPFELEELLLRVKNLLANAQNRNVEEQEIITSKVNKSVSTPKRSTEAVKVSNEDLEWLRQVEAIAIREIRSTIYSVDDLAKELLLSRSKTYKKIKRITGLTPKKYLNTIRLQKAKTILETQEVETLKEVCLAIGFENSTHFSKLFENEFGKRPHVYLNKTEV